MSVRPVPLEEDHKLRHRCQPPRFDQESKPRRLLPQKRGPEIRSLACLKAAQCGARYFAIAEFVSVQDRSVRVVFARKRFRAAAGTIYRACDSAANNLQKT